MSIVAQVLREYGQAMRNDWSEIDGRFVRDDMNYLADEVENPTKSIEELRDDVGVCPNGNGHWAGKWFGYCNAEDCPAAFASNGEWLS